MQVFYSSQKYVVVLEILLHIISPLAHFLSFMYLASIDTFDVAPSITARSKGECYNLVIQYIIHAYIDILFYIFYILHYLVNERHPPNL